MLIARLARAALAGALVAAAATAYLSAHFLGRAEQWLEAKQYAPALTQAMLAERVGWSAEGRLQLPLIADQVLQATGKAPLSDEFYRIGLTASPYHPGLRLARLRYLKTFDKNPEEQKTLIAALLKEQPRIAKPALQRMGIE